MKLDPRHLEIIAAIVDNGGLTEAARQLGKSQPSLSRTLSELEQRVGAKLFHPGQRPLRPTQLGIDLAVHGRQVRDATQAASSLLDRESQRLRATIRIGGTPIFMEGVVSTLIAEFQNDFPDLRVDQQLGYTEELIEEVREGSLDLAICPMHVDHDPRGLAFRPVLPGRNVLATRSGHPLTRNPTPTLSDLAAYPWIAPPTSSPLYKDLRRTLTQIGADELKIRFSSGTLASVLGILSSSDALTVLPYSVVVHPSRKETLATLPFDVAHPDRRLGILFRTGDPPRAVRSLVEFLTDRLGRLARELSEPP